MLNKTDLNYLRGVMEDYRSSLLERIAHDSEDHEVVVTVENYSGSDLAGDVSLREVRNLMHDRTTRQLNKIERALQRMEDGIYGICAHCGESILLSRLRVKPYAMLCVNCQFKYEKK